MSKEHVRIKLGDGYSETIIDKDDLDTVSQWTWWRDSTGRCRRQQVIDGQCRTIYLHRFLMCPPAGMDVDHINRNPLDNRRANLRIATRSQNRQNSGKPKRQMASSLYKGVRRYNKPDSKRPWEARITSGGKTRVLGAFSTEIEAAQAYDNAAVMHFGECACLNFPKDNENGHLSPKGCDP